jgi:cell division septation protein DedD
VGGDNSDIGAFELHRTHHTRGNMNPHTNIRGATIGGATALLAIALVACAALLMPHVAGASKERTRTVDATMKIAIIEQTEGVNHFAGRFTGKPGGTAAVLGVAAVTNTPTGVITESTPTLYAKKGTQTLKTTDVVEFQPTAASPSPAPSRSPGAAADTRAPPAAEPSTLFAPRRHQQTDDRIRR